MCKQPKYISQINFNDSFDIDIIVSNKFFEQYSSLKNSYLLFTLQ